MELNINTTLQRDNFLMNIRYSFDAHITGIFGHSGAGKTSLLHMISGLETTAEGVITLNGDILMDTARGKFVPPYSRNIGVVFQDSLLFPHMTVEENLKFGQRFIGQKHKRMKFDNIVEMLELQPLLKSYPAKISGGEGRRVAIGRALLAEPDLMLLDEPFAAIDSNLRGSILRFIRRLSTNLDIPMIVISHSLHDLLALTDNLIILKQGSILGAGRFIDLISDPGCGRFVWGSGMLNMLPAVQESHNENVTLLRPAGSTSVAIKSIVNPVVKDKNVQMTIQPSDIMISLFEASEISACNRHMATITKIVETDHNVLCCLELDKGVELIAEITHDSRRRLQLNVGTAYWCIFKTSAVKYF